MKDPSVKLPETYKDARGIDRVGVPNNLVTYVEKPSSLVNPAHLPDDHLDLAAAPLGTPAGYDKPPLATPAAEPELVVDDAASAAAAIAAAQAGVAVPPPVVVDPGLVGAGTLPAPTPGAQPAPDLTAENSGA